MRLLAIRFRYVKGFSPEKFETIPFYICTLRRFLALHSGRAIWVKGGRVRREAYLIFHYSLLGEVAEMLLKPLREEGYFTFTAADPEKVIRETLRLNRKTIGYLNIGNIRLGTPPQLTVEEIAAVPYNPQDLCEGYPLNLESPIRIGDDILIHFEKAYAKKWRKKSGREDVLITLENVEVCSRFRPEFRGQRESLCIWWSDIASQPSEAMEVEVAM